MLLNYSYEDIVDLEKVLRGYENEPYYYLSDFLNEHLEYLTDGLREPGSAGSAAVIQDLEQFFPDVLYALRMPAEELPLYINRGVGQEYPIAVWRLHRLSG